MPLHKQTQARFAPLLRKQGLRATPARLKVLTAFQGAGQPLSIQQLALRLGKAKVNQATLYRMLKQLVAADLVHQVNFREAGDRYELERDGPHHHHAVCQSCGTVEDVHVNDQQLVKHVTKQSKFKIQQHTFEFFGLCGNCQ